MHSVRARCYNRIGLPMTSHSSLNVIRPSQYDTGANISRAPFVFISIKCYILAAGYNQQIRTSVFIVLTEIIRIPAALERESVSLLYKRAVHRNRTLEGHLVFLCHQSYQPTLIISASKGKNFGTASVESIMFPKIHGPSPSLVQ